MESDINKKWCVYVHISPSQKMYFGITSQKPSCRWKNGNGYIDSPYFYNAIQKYGWNNIRHYIIKENLSEFDAKEMEKDLIKKYKTTDRDKGYNISEGGDGAKGIRRFGIENSFYGKHHSDETKKLLSKLKGIAVCQFDLDLNFIKEYSSALEAETETGIYQSMILGCCHKKTGYKTAGGYVWIFKDDLRNIDFDKYKQRLNHEKLPKQVSRYTLNGIYIDTFNSIGEASKKTEIPSSNISSAINGSAKQAGGYLWTEAGNKLNVIYNNACYKPVYQFSIDGEFIKGFSSRNEAAKAIGVSPQAIGYACKSKKHISRGFIWRYKEDYDKEVNYVS